MTRLHRYLLAELFKNSLVTLAVVLFVFFLIALAIVIGRPRAEGIPFHLVVEHTAYNCIATLFLTVPMTVLTATLFTYGRLRADGEFTAIRVAGIHPWRAIVPAVAFGSVATFGLAWLQDEAMPKAALQSRVELTQDLARNIEGILKRSSGVVERSWKARWTDRGQDDDGKLVLFDLELFELRKTGRVKAHTVARFAKPILDRFNEILTFELLDFERWDDGRYGRAKSFVVSLPLEAITNEQATNRRDRERSYEELLTRATRKRESAAVASGGERKKLLEDARESETAWHFRIAFAFSSAFFALFGACLGLHQGLGNRIVVFIVGFLVVVAGYYPIGMVGSVLGERGVVPAWAGTWAGNLALAIVGLVLLRRVVRA